MGGGGGGGWLRVNLVLRFGPNLRLRLRIWYWTKLNNIAHTLLGPNENSRKTHALCLGEKF